MNIIGSATQIDPINQNEIYIAVKVHGEFIGLTLSEEHGPDMDAFFEPEQCEKIIQWLQAALLAAKKAKEG